MQVFSKFLPPRGGANQDPWWSRCARVFVEWTFSSLEHLMARGHPTLERGGKKVRHGEQHGSRQRHLLAKE
jgi:hypothetical protein